MPSLPALGPAPRAPRGLPVHGAEVPERTSRPRWAVAAKGFRPFFLLAAAFGAAFVPLWLGVLGGALRPGGPLAPAVWHAHEMVFGFAVAVIAGFLLTAVGNWTQRETAVGAPLLALAALWTAGRVAMLLPDAFPRAVTAAVDLAFLPALGVVLARPLVAARNRRNYVMLAVLAALFVANVVVHLDALGQAPGAARGACLFGLDVVVLVILVITGRVLPMFTRNATGAETIRSRPRLDVATVAAMAAVALVDAVRPESAVAAGLAGVAGVLAIARAWGWRTRLVLRHPLLWVLHVGYAWVPGGLLLRLVARLDADVPASLATHALTVGAVGSLTLGMMARVALGHSGRPLVAPRPMSLAFAAMGLAAVARVVAPLVAPGAYFAELVVAGSLFSGAFVVYLLVYAPMLVTPRADGKPG